MKGGRSPKHMDFACPFFIMTVAEYIKLPLIQIRCVRHIPKFGKRCMHWLGDMISGQHQVQNFRCSDCGVEWLVEKDSTDAVVFYRIPKNTKKNYKKDTGLRVEAHDKAVSG